MELVFVTRDTKVPDSSLMNPFTMYSTVGYKNTRETKQTLVIDLGDNDHTSAPSKFNTDNITFRTKLQEPLRIDSLCDVYLDCYTTFDCVRNNDSGVIAHVINIDQLPIQTASNHPRLHRALVIPNENHSGGLTIHKGLKSNYVCQMNPQTLDHISGSIRNVGIRVSSDIDSMSNDDTYRVIMEFLFVSRA